MSYSEEQPLLLHPEADIEGGQVSKDIPRWREGAGKLREKTAEKLETKAFHRIIIGLITIDSVLVLVDLSYAFLSKSCDPIHAEPPYWLEILSHISLAITVIFVVELIVFALAFGPNYYNPFRSILHFCDGFVIVATFVIEVVLKGNERELASLLILFRLVRFAAEAAVGVGELNEGTGQELEEVKRDLVEKTQALQSAQQEILDLKRRLSKTGSGI